MEAFLSELDNTGEKVSVINREAFPFNLIALGTSGNSVEISENTKTIALQSSLACFSKLDIKNDLSSKYLEPKCYMNLDASQRFVDKPVNLSTLFQLDSSNLNTVKIDFKYKSNLLTGAFDLHSFSEVHSKESVLTAQNSSSMKRGLAPSSNFVRGNSSNAPFIPGGFDPIIGSSLKEDFDIDFSTLDTVPPGLDRGMVFESDSVDVSRVVNLEEVFLELDHKDLVDFEPDSDNTKTATAEESLTSKDVDELLPDSESTDAIRLFPKKTVQEGSREFVHMVDVNDSFSEFQDLVPEMAFDFPFELDVFQKHAIYHLEKSESVFIAAHTSAGKTVIAEYAIALAMKHMTRAIYTSPIKALSNQKFRDFRETFNDVGILTGDIQIKPEAACLIMTTEILRSMLYRGADVIRDVEFVIFDEVHYLNDAERGVVWEEVIIMLPEHVTLILLSATVPNTKEFAGWVGRTKTKDIYVISTLKRPVPLEHYIFVDKGIHQIVDSSKNFYSSGYKKAYEVLNPPKKDTNNRNISSKRGNPRTQTALLNRSGGKTNNTTSDKQSYVTLVGFLKKKELLPCIIFAFSKKKCEEYAGALSNLDLISGASEKSKIHSFIQSSLACLNGSDKELPQIIRMTELLGRGIALHHSGLLPILKEIVEILFTRGLVKVLFATETFAMGVNAPAKTVVFAMIRKHDGVNFRNLLPGEYTQMAGRAGRRGLDSTGMVIIACGGGNMPEELELRTMILGKATRLESQFRVTYNMILNLLRVEAIKVEDMIKRSFSENASQKALPTQERKYLENLKVLKTIEKLECSICDRDISEFYQLSLQVLASGYKMQERILNSPVGAKALTGGRLVTINNQMYRNTVAVILKSCTGGIVYSALNASRSISDNSFAKQAVSNRESKSFWVLVLVPKDSLTHTNDMALPVTFLNIPLKSNLAFEVELVPYAAISTVSSHQVKLENVDELLSSRKEKALMSAALLTLEVAESFRKSGMPEMDWSKIRELDFQQAYSEKTKILQSLRSFQCQKCPDLHTHYGILHQHRQLQEQLAELEHNMSDLNLDLLPDYHQRIEVLKGLKFIDENSIVQIKGRVACEINTADELILTELILENFLVDFDPAEIVALLSCFVFQEKSQSVPVLTPKLEAGIERIKETAIKVAQIQRGVGLDILVEEAVRKLNFGLVEVVYEWARGLPFKHITDLTDVLEGSIVRCIVRLSETCREVSSAARLIGDPTLYRKLEESAELIKRDIVFAASLYF